MFCQVCIVLDSRVTKIGHSGFVQQREISSIHDEIMRRPNKLQFPTRELFKNLFSNPRYFVTKSCYFSGKTFFDDSF